MIHSTSHLDGFNRADAVAFSNAKSAPSPKVDSSNGELLSRANTQALRDALDNAPEIRPEVVTRGKQLAVDGNYPPRAIIESLAKLMVESRDMAD